MQYQLSSASMKTIIKKDLSCSNVGSQEMSTELLKKNSLKRIHSQSGCYKLTNCNCVFTFTNTVVVFINESKQEGGVDISHNIFAFENLK